MADEPKTRRDFLDVAIAGGLIVCAGGMLVPAAAYLWPARSRGPRETPVPVGSAEAFAPGTARLLQVEGRPILVIALGENRFRAFSAICTHLGCVVTWDGDAGRIVCPCHAGAFGPDGQVLAGPPPRALPEYEVIRVGNELMVRA